MHSQKDTLPSSEILDNTAGKAGTPKKILYPALRYLTILQVRQALPRRYFTQL
jgi:hypothetical protein